MSIKLLMPVTSVICNFTKNFRHYRRFTSSPVITSKKDKDTSTKPEENYTKEEASSKLNDLLQSMIQKDEEKPMKEAQIAQAVKYKREKHEKEKPIGEKLEAAAKDVAASLEGDADKTESELLNILLRQSDPGSQQLQDLIKGMKVEQTVEPVSRAQQVRESLARPSRQPLERSTSTLTEIRRPKRKSYVTVDINNAERTSYFKDFQPQPPVCEMRTWKLCVERDLRLAVTHPPANIYEQMIQWTDRGIVWKFPIDNEQGMDEEKKVSFEEHVFLEEHLEGWCPDKGPIRHFMELVCVGLSNNHWLTAEEKRQHIYWYRDYFSDKKDLISELGAGDIAVETGDSQEQRGVASS